MTKFIDFHTHLYPKEYAKHLSGFDELLNYHYLAAEFHRKEPNAILGESKEERAEQIWNALIMNTHFASESVKGILTILEFFSIKPSGYKETKIKYDGLVDIETDIFNALGLDSVIMTLDADDHEEIKYFTDNRFNRYLPSLRITEVNDSLSGIVDSLKPLYIAYSGEQISNDLSNVNDLFKFCEEKSLPLALMLGVKRAVNPDLGLAGDGVTSLDPIDGLQELLVKYPKVKVCVTTLTPESQYSLTVLARKFKNLTPFGIWWFLNNSSYIKSITNMRVNLLGNTFIPQHSDARVLEHLLYKWTHTFKELDVEVKSKNGKEFYNEQLMKVLSL